MTRDELASLRNAIDEVLSLALEDREEAKRGLPVVDALNLPVGGPEGEPRINGRGTAFRARCPGPIRRPRRNEVCPMCPQISRSSTERPG